MLKRRRKDHFLFKSGPYHTSIITMYFSPSMFGHVCSSLCMCMCCDYIYALFDTHYYFFF